MCSKYKVIEPKGAALDSITDVVPQGNTKTPAIPAKVYYRRLKETASEVFIQKRLAECGKRAVSTTVTIKETAEGKVYASGVWSCGRAWLCPTCALKISQHRAETLLKFFQSADRQGATTMMITPTVPHHQGTPLKDLLELVNDSFRRLTKNKKFQAAKEKYGFEGFVRSVEITHGKNGWHPHLHVLVFALCEADELTELCELIFEIWADIVNRSGKLKKGQKCSRKAFNISPVNSKEGMSRYLNKWHIGNEIASGQSKKSTAGRSVFQILQDYHKQPTSKDKKLLREYENATKNKQQLTYSRAGNFKAKYTDQEEAQEKTDFEIANEKKEGIPTLAITRLLWNKIVKIGSLGWFLHVYQESGQRSARKFLKRKGIEVLTLGDEMMYTKDGFFRLHIWDTKKEAPPIDTKISRSVQGTLFAKVA